MTRNELKKAIELPATKLGVNFQPWLVERILDDVGNEPGNLPLLEFALTLLWEQQKEKQLTHESYSRIGGVKGALAGYANDVYTTLIEENKEQSQLLRRVFVQLVSPGVNTEDTRRVATHVEIGEDGWALVRRLADVRLVVTSESIDGQKRVEVAETSGGRSMVTNSAGGEKKVEAFETAEIVHEALIQSWEQLKVWMNADRSFRAWQEQFRQVLRQWSQSNQDKEALLRGTSLVEAKRWLKERAEEFNALERDYLFRSILHEGVEIEKWLPLYGTIEETLSFLDSYTKSADEVQRVRGIEAIRWVPHGAQNDEVYGWLQSFALNDESKAVREKAVQSILELGCVDRLTELLAPQKLSVRVQHRLRQALASVRNVPEIGSGVKTALINQKMLVLTLAAWQLLVTYRYLFATVLFFSYLFSTVIYYISQLLVPILQNIEMRGLEFISFDTFNITIAIAFGLYLLILKQVIDGKRIQHSRLYRYWRNFYTTGQYQQYHQYYLSNHIIFPGSSWKFII